MDVFGQTCVSWSRLIGRLSTVLVLVSTLLVNAQPFHSVWAQTGQSDASSQTVFLPFVSNSSESGLGEQETVLQGLLLNQPGQRHTVLKLNLTLVEQARRKAQDMANRTYFGHTDPDGFGPNYWARQAGYVFPSYYGTEPNANNIESIAAGYGDANSVWEGWMKSSGHRSHLLGEHAFYQEQIDYGIGYVYKDNGSFSHYWVILIAKPG